jgi:ketopantoate hydroxymethyltransferase
VRQYAELGSAITEAIGRFADDVRSGAFPAEAEAYQGPEDLLD